MIPPKRFLTYLIACLFVVCARAQDLRLIRSLSGPSGRTEGSNFVLTETRNRFVYPQDKSFVVYFEWDAPPGQHVLTAMWKQPDGRIASMSPDVMVDSKNRDQRRSPPAEEEEVDEQADQPKEGHGDRRAQRSDADGDEGYRDHARRGGEISQF